MKRKIHCKNCGTTLKDTDLSCPICHMKPDRTEEEVKELEEKIIHNDEKTIVWKFVIAFLLIIGIILTFIGFIHIKEVTYCASSSCTTKNLFMLFLGLAVTIASIITLIKFSKK